MSGKKGLSVAATFLFVAFGASWAVALRVDCRHKKSPLQLHSSTESASVSKGKGGQQLYRCGLVELAQPRRGPQRLPQSLVNDAVLYKSVREVSETLYVYVHASPDEPQSNVCEYISSVYSRLWDEMLLADSLGLNCVVVGNIAGANFVTREQLHSLHSLEVLYSFDATIKETMEKKGLDFVYSVAAAPVEGGGGGSGAQFYYFDSDNTAVPRFDRVALGGTFDKLHNGHKKLLTLAASCTTQSLVIGITGDVMLKAKSNAAQIASFEIRSQAVTSFLQAIKPALRLEPVELADPFGPTISDATIQAIAVSSETIPGAIMINEKRKEVGMPPLHVLVSRRGETATLSSTFLRGLQNR